MHSIQFIEKGGNEIKQIPNLLTTFRLVFSFGLLFVTPFSLPFFLLYLFCGISDGLDGYIARKWHSTSSFGALLDSVSDAVFIGVLLLVLIPHMEFTGWMLGWIGVIFCIRLLSLAVGFFRFQKLTFLHTIANKITGLALFCFPLMLFWFGLSITTCVLCTVASLSAIEELMINLFSKTLNRDVPSLFCK